MNDLDRMAHTTQRLDRDGLTVKRIERHEWASRSLPLSEGVIITYHVEKVQHETR